MYVKGETAVRLRFSWHSDRIDPMRIADSTSPILGLEDPRRVEVAGSRAVAGNNGSIATTPCETRGGSQFTLAVLLDGGFDTNRNADRSDLEAFMKAYFPATVETLGCA
ncbi:hypothetical protein DN402_14490 [Streptomyces sp. SW4]|nr:hypothetical protein DN402_14490 [Streptomyces sp. SW4]